MYIISISIYICMEDPCRVPLEGMIGDNIGVLYIYIYGILIGLR